MNYDEENNRITEYAAVRDGGAGLIDLSASGRIMVSGSESVMFLNGLITNDMKTLAANSWMPAAFPNVQGRLLAAVRVLNLSDRFLIDTERATHAKVLELLSRFTLAGDFRVVDASEEIATLSIQGQGAANIIRAVLGDLAAYLERGKVLTVPFSQSTVTIICATHTAEAGIPHYGVDMDETTVLSETNLDDAISFTKGCYIGQEIIVRIMHRGHVAKKLTGLVFDGQEKIESGAKVFSDTDQEIGRVTSSTISSRMQRALALAYVKYDYLAPGTKIKVADLTGTVAELPFIRGSWYDDVS